MLLSVIIPTYNRQLYLQEALAALAQQTLAPADFEVIVVDDGSTDGTREVVETAVFPTALHHLWQENQGDATARNTGAAQSQGEIILFLDDDILVQPDFLAQIAKAHKGRTRHIIVGQDELWLKTDNPLATARKEANKLGESKQTLMPIPFANVCSNNMSLRRKDYFAVGQMEPLNFAGSDIWCDVEFNYRAYQQGFTFARCTKAHCYHRDYVEASLESKKRRMEEVAYRAGALFEKHPHLLHHLPMFDDKTTPLLRHDSLSLIMRKLLRIVMSTPLSLRTLEKLYTLLSERLASAAIRRLLERLIIGGYIYIGYRRGLTTQD